MEVVQLKRENHALFYNGISGHKLSGGIINEVQKTNMLPVLVAAVKRLLVHRFK